MAAEHVTTDAGLDTEAMVGLARAFAETSGDDVTSHELPVVDWTTGGGARVLLLDPARGADIDAVLAAFREPVAPPVPTGAAPSPSEEPTPAVTTSTQVAAQDDVATGC